MFSSSKQVQYLRKLLTSYSTIATRQTIFASASIPQHNRFLSNCVQQKWTKVLASTVFSYELLPFQVLTGCWFFIFDQNDVVHIHVNALSPLPSCLRHRYVVRYDDL